MYHPRFEGTHREMGARFGKALAARGVRILKSVPFALTGAHYSFSESCLPLYEAHCPEIVDEIRGLSEGQGDDFKDFCAVLFSMYCLVPSSHCSCFAAKSNQGALLGRNSDFLIPCGKSSLNAIYRFSEKGFFSFSGNTTAFVEMEDGVNERGLAIGLTSAYPTVLRPGINAGILLRMVLERCSSVQEATGLIASLPRSSSEAFVMADSHGDVGLIECNADRFERKEGGYVFSTNAFHLPSMRAFRKEGFDDWGADERYRTLLGSEGLLKEGGPAAAERVLAGKNGFLCQYDRSSGHDTIWSAVYDMASHTIRRCEGNPGRRPFFEDKRFKFPA